MVRQSRAIEPGAALAIASAVLVIASMAPAQNFNTCRTASSEAYTTDVVAQRGMACVIELRRLGISSAQITTLPTNGRAEISGAIPILTYQSSATFVGRDRIVLRASGREVPTGLWTVRITVR
jgi:hypothetical protein